jgi:anti-sigma-K factor RskA
LDIQTYISSGVIENYVLGATTAEEAEEVEKLAAIYPEIQAEIEANRLALLEYVLQFEQEPPAELRDKVLAKITALETEFDTQTTKQTKNIVMPSSSRVSYWMLAASWALLVLSIGLNIWMIQGWRETHRTLSQVRNAQESNNRQIFALQTKYKDLHQELSILQQPSNQLIELKGTNEFPEAKVVLVWNQKSKEVFVKIQNLPKPPNGKQYQLWSIDGKEVKDAGMIILKGEEFVICKMKNVNKANAFAITLEKTGGVQKAEGAMYVLGEV